MPSPKLNPEQAKKQKEAMIKYNASPDRHNNAGIPRVSRDLKALRGKFKELSEPAFKLISKAVKGDLVAEKSIWKGSEADKIEILNTDPSASFEMFTLDSGKEVEVLIQYVSINPKQVEMAKWVLTQESSLHKAVEESKLRAIEIAMKNKKAKDEGALPKDDETQQQIAKDFGGPKRLNLDYIPEEDEEDSDE